MADVKTMSQPESDLAQKRGEETVGEGEPEVNTKDAEILVGRCYSLELWLQY